MPKLAIDPFNTFMVRRYEGLDLCLGKMLTIALVIRFAYFVEIFLKHRSLVAEDRFVG